MQAGRHTPGKENHRLIFERGEWNLPVAKQRMVLGECEPQGFTVDLFQGQRRLEDGKIEEADFDPSFT